MSSHSLKGMIQKIDRKIVQVDFIGVHTMFLYRMIRDIFQELNLVIDFLFILREKYDHCLL